MMAFVLNLLWFLALINQPFFSAAINEQAHMSNVSMAMASILVDNAACELFEGMDEAVASAFATIAAVTAGRSGGGQCRTAF